ncbi:TetR/AcrR family transcriptional regulator [Nonomuraea glycinis]|uniref:TetR family transcriptional regulator n=1 Tax=Nonomuraea glycinis TaxID=2047744 RepID=A0A918A0E2_9ACTN|nr:TetR/AcrR family transcriptional regulator [Nonomuraea glycinis]MCA2177103.1 TetR/AcrR family transcriptional regulator [Nonomuraea glycinis]GGP02659.1 TetR family transcriptional regulator [Nonomuraea glycinis]
MTADPEIRMRADARRNRDQIIAAAREMFVARGADAPMEEIARTAGVGVGTLYRRFPDRESLIRAVAKESFAQVLQDARAARADEPTGWDALQRLIARSRQLQVSFLLAWNSTWVQGILQADPEIGEIRNTLMVEISHMVTTAQAEGTMRTDIGTGDMAVLLLLILRQSPVADALGPFAAERTIAIMLDGLRATANGGLPGHPITVEALRWPGRA